MMKGIEWIIIIIAIVLFIVGCFLNGDVERWIIIAMEMSAGTALMTLSCLTLSVYGLYMMCKLGE